MNWLLAQTTTDYTVSTLISDAVALYIPLAAVVAGGLQRATADTFSQTLVRPATLFIGIPTAILLTGASVAIGPISL